MAKPSTEFYGVVKTLLIVVCVGFGLWSFTNGNVAAGGASLVCAGALSAWKIVEENKDGTMVVRLQAEIPPWLRWLRRTKK